MSQSNITALKPPMPSAAPPKSRKRRYYIAGFVLLLLATPAAFYFVAGWLGERELEEIYAELDAEDPNWRWHDLMAQQESVPDERNSALQIDRAYSLLLKKPLNISPTLENALARGSSYPNTRLDGDTAQMLQSAFDALDTNAVVEARKLKDMPNGRFTIEGAENPFAIKLDHVQNGRAVVYLLQHDTMLRAQQGDFEGAAESCQAILNTGREMKSNPFLIGLLVRIALQHVSVAAIEWSLGQHDKISEENLKKLQELLDAEIQDDGLHDAMRGERASGQQAYQLLRERKLSVSQLTNMEARGLDWLLDAFPGVILDGYPEYLRLMNEQVRASKLKDMQREEAYRQLDLKLRQRPNLLTRMIMPATTKVVEASRRSQAFLRCAAVAVAAERYRLKHDSWPHGMDELVKAGSLKEAFIDPYDGKALRWKSTPTGIIIYSIGADRADNGGKRAPNGVGPGTAGTDLGFELWNPRLRHVAPVAVEEAPR